MTDTTQIPPKLPPGYVLTYEHKSRSFFDWLYLGSWVGRVTFPDRYYKGYSRAFGSSSGFLYSYTEAGVIRAARRAAWREERARHKYERGEITVDL